MPPGRGFRGPDQLDPMRPFVGEGERSNLVLVRRKSDSMTFSPLMGPKMTSDLPGGVKEGSDELGAHENIVQYVNIYDLVKFRENLSDCTFAIRTVRCPLAWIHLNTSSIP